MDEEMDKATIMQCLRCKGIMRNMGVYEFQLGSYGFLTGGLSNLVSGALVLNLYVCSECKKVEFFHQDENSRLNELPTKICQKCGNEYPAALHACPVCIMTNSGI